MKHLVILSAVFAILKFYGHLNWDWITVVSPILVGHALHILRGTWWATWAVMAFLSRRQDIVDDYCLRLEKRATTRFEKLLAAIKVLHESMSPKRKG